MRSWVGGWRVVRSLQLKFTLTYTLVTLVTLTALYLEDYVNEREYRAFVLIEQRMRGMNILPGTVSVMRRFMQERGSKFQSINDWVRVFPKQLRVAKRLVSL